MSDSAAPPPCALPARPREQPVQRAVESLFAALARLRGGRALHTDGTVFDAHLSVDPASAVGAALGGPATRPAVVRMSRSVSLPGRAPDLLGVALRVAAGPGLLDMLLASVGRHDRDHVLLLPATGWWKRPYSTLLPYRVDGRLLVLGLTPPPVPGGPAPADAAATVARAPVVLTVTEQPLGGRRHEVGRLVLTGPRTGPDAHTFDPIRNALPRLRPVRTLGLLRELAYTGSRRGRRADPADLYRRP